MAEEIGEERSMLNVGRGDRAGGGEKTSCQRPGGGQ